MAPHSAGRGGAERGLRARDFRQVLRRLVGRPDEAAEDPPDEAADVVHHREERRHEDQRQHGRDEQAADHRDRHRRAELAAVAERHARWGSCRPTIAIVVMTIGRARLRPASITASMRGTPLRHLLDGEVDQHDGVLGDDAHQHQHADVRPAW